MQNLFYLLAQSSSEDAAAGAAGGIVGLGMICVYAVIYLFGAFCLFKIATKLGHENPWFAFVPILNVVQWVQMSGKEMWWVILFFIPCANIVAAVMTSMAVAERLNRPSWWGIMLMLPCANVIFLVMMAFTDA